MFTLQVEFAVNADWEKNLYAAQRIVGWEPHMKTAHPVTRLCWTIRQRELADELRDQLHDDGFANAEVVESGVPV